jgi:hypothetical protein
VFLLFVEVILNAPWSASTITSGIYQINNERSLSNKQIAQEPFARKLVFSILGDVLDYMVQNRVRSLPTETPLKKPLFHKKVWGRKPSTELRRGYSTLYIDRCSSDSIQFNRSQIGPTLPCDRLGLRRFADWVCEHHGNADPRQGLKMICQLHNDSIAIIESNDLWGM